MQLSPYRIQLAGIQTAPAMFRPLVREFKSSGLVALDGDAATVRLEIPARQAPWIATARQRTLPAANLRAAIRFRVLCKPCENTTPTAGNC